MEKDRKSEAMNDEFELPDVIIQRIQSFLNGKEAAQTTILSKSWYKAWLTRPNLDFDELHFRKNSYDYNSKTDKLFELTKKTIQRYEQSNLKIESFRICTEELVRRGDDSNLAKDLIVKALKIGATRLSLEIQDRLFVVPHEVFGSENLVHLSLKGCRFDIGMGLDVRCSRLESLSLSTLEIEDYDMISNIILSCPLIEKLSLSSIHEFRGRGMGFVDRPIINLRELHKLRCLVLSGVTINTLFFSDFVSRFPSLKELILEYCKFNEEIQISSCSLERLYFKEDHRKEGDPKPKMLRVKFDVPNIRMLTFNCGSVLPSGSFKPTSREWESHVSIKSNDVLSTSWFRQLNKFLSQLNLSKIYLSLDIFFNTSFDYEVGDIECVLKPEVENLTMDVDHLPSLTCYALYDALFRLRRPKFITQYWLHDQTYLSNDFLCKRLVQATNRKSLTPVDFMYGLNDLEEVNAEISEKGVEEWQPLPLKSLLDGSTKSKDKRRVRFQLKWRANDLT